MTYPATPLQVEADLMLGTTWTDAVASGIRHDPHIKVSTGRADWADAVDTAQANFTMSNPDGRWSPDYTDGANWGTYKRNIPCRIGVKLGGTYLESSGRAGLTTVSTPSTGVLSFSTPHDVRAEFQLHLDPVDIVRGGTRIVLADKSNGGATEGWFWWLYMVGHTLVCAWVWYDNANVLHSATTEASGSEVPYWLAYQRSALRTVFTPSTGTTTFYYSDSISGTWVQIGASVVTGATTLKTTTGALRVGGDATEAFGSLAVPGKIYSFELRDVTGGTTVANPVFSAQTAGASSFADAAGRTWTVGSGGRITNVRWRFHGELATTPIRWDLALVNQLAPVEANGILRRVRQANTSLESAYYRGVTRSMASCVNYWPCEEDSDFLTAFGPAVGQQQLSIAGGVPDEASGTPFASSRKLREMGVTIWTASVDTYSAGVAWTLRWLMSVPATGYPTGADLRMFHIWTDNDLSYHVKWRGTDGAMGVECFKAGAGLVYDSGWLGVLSIGVPLRMQLTVRNNGGNVDVVFLAQPANQASGSGFSDLAVTAGSCGSITQIRVNPDVNHGNVALGHISIQSFEPLSSELQTSLNAWIGETAADRVQRLCVEEGLPSRIMGSRVDSEFMGPQLPVSLSSLLQECADTDGGILYEPRESISVGYRTRVSMQSQTAKVFDYTGGQMAGSIDLDRDDNGFANDITADPVSGTKGRAVLNDGSNLSISAPPTGAGRYPRSFSVNCDPGRANDMAGWRLRLAAVDEPRVSNMQLETNLHPIVASAALTEQILLLVLGDLMEVDYLPPTAYGSAASSVVRQLIQGVDEEIWSFGHHLDLNTSPASPWDVAVYS